MKTAVETLRERVLRAKTSKHAPFRGTLRGGETKEIRPCMSDADYQRLVARGECQAWTRSDVERLRDRVRRLA